MGCPTKPLVKLKKQDKLLKPSEPCFQVIALCHKIERPNLSVFFLKAPPGPSEAHPLHLQAGGFLHCSPAEAPPLSKHVASFSAFEKNTSTINGHVWSNANVLLLRDYYVSTLYIE